MNEMRSFHSQDELHDDDQGIAAGIKKIPSVAVVILNWNGRAFLEKFLPSVIASTYTNKRIIVADNASTDDSVAFLRQNFPTVELIQNATNEGFAKGYNTALKQVQSDYYVLLNSDVEVTSGWIEPVIELMENDRVIAACQPKILAYTNKHQFEYAGACGGWMDNFGYPFARGRVFDDVEEDKGQYDNASSCFWASGAALFIRAAVYHEVEGLDERFFAHQEEIDLCWRLQLKGYKIYVEPASRVFHVGGGTLAMGNARKTFLNFRNNLIMLSKNLPIAVSIYMIPERILLDMIAAVKALLGGNGETFGAIFKAHIYFIRWLLSTDKKARPATVKPVDLQGWYNGSVVYQYFIKGRKTFSQIVGKK